MPDRLITIILILHTVFTTACSHNAGHSRDVEQRLEELDRTIEEHDRFEAIKTQYIDRIKSKITPGCTEMQRYGIYDNLYDEYYQYNLDSATFYARTKLEVADRIGSPSLKYDAILDIADRYILSGMYVEASEYISQIDAGQLPHELLPRYYHVYHAYYDGCPAFDGMEYQKSWSNTGCNVRKFLVKKSDSPEYNTNPSDFVVYRYAYVLLMKAEALNEQGNTDDACAPLNIVRERAGLPAVGKGKTQEEMRELIIHERRRGIFRCRLQ